MIRLSLGSAIELGLINKKNDIPPTTIYHNDRRQM